MKLTTTTTTILLACVPVALAAQSPDRSTSASAAASADARISVEANTTPEEERRIMAGLSAEGRVQLSTILERAEERRLPRRPILAAVAEGQAKGAAEARLLRAAHETSARLETALDVMARAGREHPSADEIALGASALAMGATSAQLEGLVKRSPSDRSLVTAFDVLTRLAAHGVPVAEAVARVGARLEAGASDAALGELAAGLQGHGSAAAG
ncbi:MAG TPA: hypothetical protein VNK43_00845, partial [Gemmatimonadales bacterium]|nr:hypothetical protein [Gemmatimonadales bacterium]